MTELTKANNITQVLQGAEAALTIAATPQEVEGIRETLEMMGRVAKAINVGVAEINHIKAMTWRAERELGKKLLEVVKRGGSKYRDGTLENLGISRKLSARAQKMAQIHIEDLETFINDWDETQELNQSHLLSLLTQSNTPPPNDFDATLKKILGLIRKLNRMDGDSRVQAILMMALDDIEELE